MCGEGDGTPLQYSWLENPMDGGAWWAAVHEVAKSRTRLSNLTLPFHFHALEKEMATHSSILAWKIPQREEPGGLQSWIFFSLSIWLFAVRLSDWAINTSNSTGRNTLYRDNDCAYDSSSRKSACAGEEPRGQVQCGERCTLRDCRTDEAENYGQLPLSKDNEEPLKSLK